MKNLGTILLAGGGTGGHLYPGVAVAEALTSLLPDVRLRFVCTQREIDRVILEPTGYSFTPQPIVPPVKTVSGLLKFWRSWRETKDLLRGVYKEEHIVAAVGLGGYAAGVAIAMAARRKIPCILLNPDVIPGKANQFLMSKASAVCCQFAKTSEYVSTADQPKLRVTGCPIRTSLLCLPSRADALQRLGLDPSLRTLVITGASLGAKTVNEAAALMLSGISLSGWQVLHLAGHEHAQAVRAQYRETEIPVKVIDFTPAMSDIWGAADLAVSRAGASSCAELTACGVPSALMPYPFHKDMHQRLNASVLADAGAAVLVEDVKDARKNADRLREVIEPLLHDADKRRAMSEAARRLGEPQAATRIAEVIAELSQSRR